MEASRRGFRAGILLGLFLIVLCLPLTKISFAAQTTQVVLYPSNNAYVDSGNSNTNYGGSTILATEAYNWYDLSTRYMNSWLMFDLSSIPPSATITSAVLSVTGVYSDYYSIVGSYSSASNSWSEDSITWNNQPSQGVTPTDTQYVTNSTSLYSWSVTSLVADSLSSGAVSVVLKPTSSQSSNSKGYSVYYSKEAGSSVSPSLTITYSYVSSAVSVPSSVQYGNGVTITGNTDPVQSEGTTVLEYSSDQVVWNNIASGSGGTYSFNWTPPAAGTYYVRSSWTLTWSGGSYTANSASSELSVTPAPSSIQLSLNPTTINPSGSVSLSVTLSPQASDGTVAIQYSTDQSTWITLATGTPKSGVFTYTWSPGLVGTFYIRATWTGDTDYQNSVSSTATLLVVAHTTMLTLSAPTSASLGQSIVVIATLEDNLGNPVPGTEIGFTIGSTEIGNAVTNPSGSASITYMLTQSAGAYAITAIYDGSSTYQGSSAESALVINPWTLTITSGVSSVPLVNFNGVNYTTDISDKVLIYVNSSGNYNLRVNTPLVTAEGTRIAFVSWGDGTTSSTRTVDIDSDTSFAVTTKIQYLLTIASTYGTPLGGGWYDSGSVASFSIQSAVNQGNSTQRAFTGWSKNGSLFSQAANGTLTMNGPTSLVASWKKQFYLTLVSPYGSPSGGGWYNVGSTAVVSVHSPVSTGFLTSRVFQGWTGNVTGDSPSLSFPITGPMSLTATWTTDYTELYLVVGVIAIAVVAGGVYLLRRSAATKK